MRHTCDWRGRDGLVVRIRPVHPDDLELMKAFVAGLSARTGYQRLLSPRTPALPELRRWVDIDIKREFALVAVVEAGARQRQVGVARFVHVGGDDDAEFAIVLSDEWQGRGLGRVLLQRLIQEAHGRGLQRLVGSTLSENQGMLRLARSLGFALRRSLEGAFITDLRMELRG